MTHAMTSALSQPVGSGMPSPFVGADVCAAANLPVLAGTAAPMFDDDVWDFTCVMGLAVRTKSHTLRWAFTRIVNPAWRLVAKEYLLALLAPGHEVVRLLPYAYRVPRHLTTCAAKLVELTAFFNWLTSHGISSLADVDQARCDAYIEHRSWQRTESGDPTAPRSKSSIAVAHAVLIDLANYTELFTADRYQPAFRPWKGRTAAAAGARTNHAENSTPPAPLEILHPLLAAALYVVDHLGEHIVTLDQQRRATPAGPALPHVPRAAGPQPILAVVRRHLAQRRPFVANGPETLPRAKISGRTDEDPLQPVSLNALALEAGHIRFERTWLPAIHAELLDAVAAVGTAPPWGRDAAPVPRADGQGAVPWTVPLFAREVMNMVRYARTACLTITAAVSGMRASELMELRRGCSSPFTPAPGVTRYRVTGKLVKDQPLGGTAEQWLVIEPVHRALLLAGRLADDPADALLFGQFGYLPLLRAFRGWVNGPAGQRLGLAPIPSGNLNPSMLRRRLAIELAYRPGGLLATKIHLKHVSVATTEGYAARPGGAQARLLAEVAAEEDKRNLDLVLAAYHDYKRGTRPAGPGARDLMAYFDTVDGQLISGPAGAPKLVPEQTVRTLLGNRAKTLHLGTANYCWFTDPAKALCLKLAGTPTASKPLAGMCDSARCPQATHHPSHRPVWQEQVTATKAFITSLGRRQTTERTRLAAELDRAQRVLDEIDSAQTATPAPDESAQR